MFRTVPVSVIRSSSLYKQQWNMSYSFVNSLRAGSERNYVPSSSCSQAVSKHVWHIPLLCVERRTPDDGQRNCPKYVEFHFKNKFEKIVHLVGFIIRNLARCMVIWMSKMWKIHFKSLPVCRVLSTTLQFFLAKSQIFATVFRSQTPSKLLLLIQKSDNQVSV